VRVLSTVPHSYLFQFANPLVASADDLEQVCALALDLQ
jgi:hypothetical protein